MDENFLNYINILKNYEYYKLKKNYKNKYK